MYEARLCDPVGYSTDNLARQKGFMDKIVRADFQRGISHHISVCRHKDNWRFTAKQRQLVDELFPVHNRHIQVGDDKRDWIR